MGRGYTAEESVEKYLSSLSADTGSCVTGLLIGQSSVQKDFVVLAVRTPHREAEGSSEGRRVSSPLDDVDAEWVAEHARQVSRMLPGGVCVLGLFLITPPELAKEAQNTLKRLIFTVDKYISKSRLWELSEEDVTDRVTLHICSKTRKAVCKTFDVKDPKCSARPADWRYQCGVSSSWPVLSCCVKVDLQIPLTESSSEKLEKCVQDGLRRWAKQIEAGLCLINGRPTSDDSDLLSGPKKNTKQQTLGVQILISEEDVVQRCSAVVQACSGSVCVRGSVHCRAYIHNNKPKTRHAAQAIKRDVVNTVSNRVEMLLEDLQMNERGAGDGLLALPCRVFSALPGSGLSLCDYMFTDETVSDVCERIKEMLDWDSAEQDVDTSVETQAGCSVSVWETQDGGDDGAAENLTVTQKSQKSSHYYTSVAVGAAVALLAAATSLLYLNE